MSERRGQEQAPKVQRPERPTMPREVPPVSSGKGVHPFTDAIRVLADLRGTIENEHWVTRPMQRAIISGITMSIKALENEAAKL